MLTAAQPDGILAESKPTEGEYQTSDQRIVVAFMCCEIPIKKTSNDGRRVVFSFDRTDKVTELLEKRGRGESMVVTDVDRFFDTLTKFHSIVHNQR